jgi:hypothetical protein
MRKGVGEKLCSVGEPRTRVAKSSSRSWIVEESLGEEAGSVSFYRKKTSLGVLNWLDKFIAVNLQVWC